MAKVRLLACPECSKPMVLKDGAFGKFYGCTGFPQCKTTHGAHPDGAPLGVPASAETRKARKEAHNQFDQLWKSGLITRKNAYAWLSSVFGHEAHIGSMTKEQCEFTILASRQRLQELYAEDFCRETTDWS